MKKILSLLLAVLMLAACGCAAPAEDAELAEQVYADEIADNADLVSLAAEKAQEIREQPAEKGYIRGGDYANMNWREINAAAGTDTNTAEPFTLKEDGSKSYTVVCTLPTI